VTDRIDLSGGEWLEENRANWDERVPVHVVSPMYDQSGLLAGRGRLTPIEEAELPVVAPDGWEGKRVLHLQCHFGADTLVLAQRGATVVGIDFSKPAILEARALADRAGLAARARFISANVYDARHVLPEPDSFDVVYTSWGTIGWLPDTAEWAGIIAWFLKPGGRLYFADGHPTAFVFESSGGPLPAFTYPYAETDPILIDEQGSYADETARFDHTRTWEWMHPLGETVTRLIEAGLRLDFMHEHYGVPWKMFDELVQRDDGLWGWPGEQWLPLGMSLAATKPLGT
jgi:SAM-dependent methyltransferase